MKPEDILPTYGRQAAVFDHNRDKTLYERKWLDRMLDYTPRNSGRPRVLDLGCGSGRPIATYLSERKCMITGVDGAAEMIALFRQNVPQAKAIHADMRNLDLNETFDAIIAWDSFFHLSAADQRAMFACFAQHMAPKATLLFTTGHDEGEAIGHVGEETIFHASLAPQTYVDVMAEHGIDVINVTLEDPECTGHSVWLARINT